jgi:nitrite reductase/ring-hydroxylating ferredoxin subunit
MAEFVTVGPADSVGEGEARGFEANGTNVAVVRVGGTLYAFNDVCTHRGCFLSGGEVEGTAIICECHGSMFSMENGEVLEGPAEDPIATYPIREQDGQLQVEV